jgi:phosphate transport system substrate-binding protein
MNRRLVALLATVGLVCLAATTPVGASVERAGVGARRAVGSQINGTGSSYVGLAMQQWTAEATVAGLKVNYTPSGSPDGLSRYAGGQVDFAGTEAEFASLGNSSKVARGYQYVPDVGGAIAVMYNVDDLSGRKVDYLHLRRTTIAKIFMGQITRWSDPAIQADNAPANLRLPDQPINVVYRSGQSGTTALFYDFIRETEPALYRTWAARNRLPDGRIIELDSAPSFAPKTQALAGSDQIAQYVAGRQGKWSIAYDEFGYAKVYGAASAWVDNSGGKWTLPYAENIAAALKSARLRPDLSQELSGVYQSRDPLTYPISAYSYLVTQCVRSGDRPTCAGPYSNSGVTETLKAWMRYIACEGQVRMAAIGYSPLPPNLSQEIANSIARLDGSKPASLNQGNCANPTFKGSLGAGFRGPPDPYEGLPANPADPTGGSGGGNGSTGAAAGAGGGTGGGSTTGGGGDAANEGSTDGTGAGEGDSTASAASGSGAATSAAGKSGASGSVGGGSSNWRTPVPVLYARQPADGSGWPWAVLLAAFAVPALAVTVARRMRRASGAN